MNNQLFDSSIVRSHELYVSSDSRNDAISGVEARGLEATRGRDRKRGREGGRRERWVALTSTFARDAVLINVEGVEHVRVAVLSLSARDRSVQIEGGTFRSRRTKLAVLLQLQAPEQWVVPQVHGRRLLRIWEQRATANHVTRVPCHACHQAPDDK